MNLLLDPDVRSAFAFAESLHDAQRDKAGFPYIGHLSRVAMRVAGKGNTVVIAALLHDSVEDSNLSIVEIRTTFGSAVAQIVEAVTHIKHQPYAEYMEQVMAGPYAAWEVKAADLADNTDPVRVRSARAFAILNNTLGEFDKAQARREAKYHHAIVDLLDHAHRKGVWLSAAEELRERFGLRLRG